MLNLFNKKIKKPLNLLGNNDYNYILKDQNFLSRDNAYIKQEKLVYKTKHYPPATKEWFNSIYSFNKNYIKSLVVADRIIIKLLYYYFNLSLIKFETRFKKYKTIFKDLSKNIIRLSANKTFVSKAEIKHSNNKVNITIYTYNKEKNYLISKLLYLSNNRYRKKKQNLRKRKTLKSIIKLRRNLIFIRKLILIIRKIRNNKSLLETLNLENLNKKQKFKEFFKRVFFLVRRNRYIYVIKKLSLYNYKYKNLILSPLSLGLGSIIKKIYNKKVDFNIVNLKYLHLNSDILSDSIVLKLENRNNRLLRVLKKALKLVKLPPLYVLFSDYNVDNTSYLKKKENILNSLKYKVITGVRLEGSGRLTRRLIASRAVFKFRHKGTLKNIESSHKDLQKSSVMLRGYSKPNLQYSYVGSKTPTGAFGIKGWVSSY